jgi:hypothetical protein
MCDTIRHPIAAVNPEVLGAFPAGERAGVVIFVALTQHIVGVGGDLQLVAGECAGGL